MNKLAALLLFTCLVAGSTAFMPSTARKWGVSQSKTKLFEEKEDLVVDTNFEGVDIVRLLGLNRVKRLIRKGERNAAKSPLKLIIAGAPASGKGTQCEVIKKQFGVTHLSTGDMLRAAVAAGSEVGIAAKEYMDAGKLVPDEVIIGIVSSSFEIFYRIYFL